MTGLDTLTPSARKGAEWALLNELVRLLEMAQENVEGLRDLGLDKWPLTADVRAELRQIAETVEALDVFGWQDIVDRGPEQA